MATTVEGYNWRCPKMGVPLNHPSHETLLSIKKTWQFGISYFKLVGGFNHLEK
jgi:hypothetical protein